MNREELAWAAGFFDGEGYTGRHNYARGFRWSPRMGITQYHAEPLVRFLDAVGCGRVYVDQTRERFAWVANGDRDVSKVFGLLAPWLGRKKIRQAAAMFAAFRAQPPPMSYADRARLSVAAKRAKGSIRG